MARSGRRSETGTGVGSTGETGTGGGLAGDPAVAAHLARALDASPDLVLVAVEGHDRIRVNATAAHILGLDGDRLDLAALAQRAPTWAGDRFLGVTVPALEAAGTWEGDLALHDEEGDLVPLGVVAVATRDAAGAVTGVTVVARDLSSQAAREGQLERQATHDALTGLPNRALLMDRLSMALGRARRLAARTAVLCLDLDHFKPVNDALGHGAGDRLLAEVAQRIEGAVRPGDTAARLGGDEFVVVCEDLASRAEAEAVARRIAEEVARPVRLDGTEVRVTASIGLALSDPDTTAPELLTRADAAMYEAKFRRSQPSGAPGP